MVNPKCPDCDTDLELVPDLGEIVWKCQKCRVEYSSDDLVDSGDFIADEEDSDDIW